VAPEGPSAGASSGELDEETAWRLVLAARVGTSRPAPTRDLGGDPWRVELEGPPPATLDIHRDGRWDTPSPPSPAARDLLDLFLPVALPADLVMGQLGQSLDGRIATEGGHSHYVTGPADRRRLHRLRALVDAVVVGAGTVALDDPRLTVREVEGRNPVRVVLDPEGRLDPGRRVFTDGAAPTLLVRRAGADARDPGQTQPTGQLELLALPAGEGGFDPLALLVHLRARGLRRILVEGGGVTVSRFLQAGLLDRLHLTVAPLLIGSGRPSLTLPPVATLEEALRPRCRRFALGEDLLFDLDLR
jgi:riboflavin-specific deaminase-like protein